MDPSGVYHGMGAKDMPISYIVTSGTYVERTTQLFVEIPTGFSTDENRLAVDVHIYGYADADTIGLARINLTRGLADSYIELVMR